MYVALTGQRALMLLIIAKMWFYKGSVHLNYKITHFLTSIEPLGSFGWFILPPEQYEYEKTSTSIFGERQELKFLILDELAL